MKVKVFQFTNNTEDMIQEKIDAWIEKQDLHTTTKNKQVQIKQSESFNDINNENVLTITVWVY